MPGAITGASGADGQGASAAAHPAAAPAAAAATATATAAAPGPAAIARTGYQGFGSFHAGNPEEMAAAAGWAPPPNPCAQAGVLDAGDVAAAARQQLFGLPARRLFLIDFGRWCFLNHGAFGGALAAAVAEAEAWRRRCEAQPLAFLDRELFPQLVRVMRELAAFLRCRPQDLALLPNATTGAAARCSARGASARRSLGRGHCPAAGTAVPTTSLAPAGPSAPGGPGLNTVIQSLRGRLGPGDSLFSLDIGYGAGQ